MEKSSQGFHLEDFTVDARLSKLNADQANAISEVLTAMEQGADAGVNPGQDGEMRAFLLPYAEFGLMANQMIKLMKALPRGWSMDHREIYFDFRLERWQRHIEPPTLEQCLEDYLEHSPSREQGMEYIKEVWDRFRKRHS